MLQAYFDDLVTGLGKKLTEKVTARRRFIYEIGRIGQRLFDPAWASAWTTVFVPFEILNAMKVSGMFVEFIGAMLAGTGAARPYFESSENSGYSTDSCSYHRTIIGVALQKILPPPSVLLATTIPCNGGVKSINRIADIYDKKALTINVPLEYTPHNVEYLINQYKRMIDFVKQETGHDIDYDQLTQSIRYNNEARQYLLEAMDYCKQVPCPANSDDWKNFIIFLLISGTKDGVEVAKIHRDELANRVAKGIAGVPGEKHRLLWVQNRIQFKNDLIDILEKKYKANVVIDELNYIHWEPMDEKDPIRSLAIRQITHPFGGSIDRRLALLKKMAQEFKVDGVVNPAHWGCRQSGGARVLFKDIMQKLDIPFLNLDVDCVDERNFSKAQVLTRLEAFMEML
jgi:benzoyl-CoA reductase/2-hydroxyglutaryl-CoA dehydratase subunit BcrC/BadD/HgdB